MTNGIILAGGRGSRMGPLAAQISKALVTIGSRPQLINHVLRLREAGCARIIVVTSPDTQTQVRGVLDRAGFGDVITRVQVEPTGPVSALSVGLGAADWYVPTVLIFSDTVIDESIPTEGRNWVGVGVSPDTKRSWCYYDHSSRTYLEGVPPDPGDPVAIGLYRFENTPLLLSIVGQTLLRHSSGADEVPMAPLLNAYHCTGIDVHDRETFMSWQDVGDLKALRRSRQSRFISRSHHELVLQHEGTIVKSNVSDEELEFMQHLGERRRVEPLFPTVYECDSGSNQYTMEFIDLPTLAEYWLYWPGSPAVWEDIIQTLVISFSDTIWANYVEDTSGIADWYRTKTFRRLVEWNGVPVDGEMMDLISRAADIIAEDDDCWCYGHGDLNFTNILYSLNTGRPRLIDPRGGKIPFSYEVAKLAYSPVFSAITHGLIDSDGDVLPMREEETKAIHEVLTKLMDPRAMKAAQALILLSAPPLHSEAEAHALYRAGKKLLDELF